MIPSSVVNQEFCTCFHDIFDIYKRLADHCKQCRVNLLIGLGNLFFCYKNITGIDVRAVKLLGIIKNCLIAVISHFFNNGVYTAFKLTVIIRASF